MPQGIVQNAKAEGLRFHSEYAPTHRSVAAKVITDSLLPLRTVVLPTKPLGHRVATDNIRFSLTGSAEFESG